MCGLLSSADSPPPEPTPPEADSPPFRLLDLAPELVLEIIEHVSSDRRSVFEGAPPELIALSATSSVFSELCRPHVWRAITFPTSPGNDVDLFPDKRTLRALREIQATRTLPIELVRIRGEWGDLDDDEHDQEALVEAVEILASDGLKAVCVEEVMFETFASRRLAERFLRSLARSASLTALQLSQVTVGTTRIRKFLPSIPHLKTLHLKHGSLSLLELVPLCPNLESLLLWPSSRSIRNLMPVIVGLLGTLRFLSLDTVSDPTCLEQLTIALERREANHEPAPLRELFLEGRQASHDRHRLINALSITPLKRLALYNLGTANPSLISEIVHALPDLEGLTLVQGGGAHEAVVWPHPVSEYSDQLRKLRHLKRFAFDRRSPVAFLMAPRTAEAAMILEKPALFEIGLACESLESVVVILHDDADETAGYLAEYERFEKVTNLKLEEVHLQASV